MILKLNPLVKLELDKMEKDGIFFLSDIPSGFQIWWWLEGKMERFVYVWIFKMLTKHPLNTITHYQIWRHCCNKTLDQSSCPCWMDSQNTTISSWLRKISIRLQSKCYGSYISIFDWKYHGKLLGLFN